MRPASACLGQEVRLCEITMFGGLSPLRGPLATGAAKARIAKLGSTMQGLPKGVRQNEGSTEYDVVRLAQLN